MDWKMTHTLSRSNEVRQPLNKRFHWEMETPGVPAFLRTFSLWHNYTRYELPGETFSRLSKRAALMMKQGESYGYISARARQESLESFISACKLEPYKVRPSTAFELLAIAEEWEVPTLQRFLNDYISSRSLSSRSKNDPLGGLLLHLQMGQPDVSDIYQVADVINEVLQDDRLLLVPPETIFRIVLAADSRHLDQQLLINFTLVLLYENPAAAVPLILLLDFGKLDEDQAEAIFLTRELHRLNLNFFAAWAMTYVRNKAETELLQFKLRELNEVAIMKEVLDRNQDDQVLQSEARHREEIGRMQRFAVDQQLELDRLMEELTNQEAQQELREKDHQKQLFEVRRLIQEMDKAGSECNENSEYEQEQLRSEVADEIDRLRQEFVANLTSVVDHEQKYMDRVKGDLKENLGKIGAESEALEQQTAEWEKAICEMNGQIDEAKAVMAVKMVRDQLRFDKFVRTTKEKLRIFKKGSIWDIDMRRAKAANKLLSSLLKAVDEACPVKDGEGLLDE
jgi:hypothetical protein